MCPPEANWQLAKSAGIVANLAIALTGELRGLMSRKKGERWYVHGVMFVYGWGCEKHACLNIISVSQPCKLPEETPAVPGGDALPLSWKVRFHPTRFQEWRKCIGCFLLIYQGGAFAWATCVFSDVLWLKPSWSSGAGKISPVLNKPLELHKEKNISKTHKHMYDSQNVCCKYTMHVNQFVSMTKSLHQWWQLLTIVLLLYGNSTS